MKKIDFSDRNPRERIRKMDELFPIFTQIMNELHDVKYSERFWRILLQGYVSTALSRYYDYKRKMVVFDVILPTGAKHISLKRKLFAYLRYFFEVLRTRNNKNRINLILKENDNICISNLFSSTLPKGASKILPDYQYFPVSYFPASIMLGLKKRKHLKKLSQNFSDPYLQNIILSVPKVFVEYFEPLLNKITLHEERHKIFHSAIFPNTYSRYVVAKYVENGSKLYGYQHGANYGEARYHPSYHYETSIADKYHTWGWKINENDVPYHAFRIRRFVEEYENISTDAEYDCLVVFGRFLSWNSEKYIEKGLNFASNIDRKRYPNILARPRKESKKSNDTINLMFLKKYNFHLDQGHRDEAPLVIKQSKIVILLHYPSTFAFECMSVNHPILCIVEIDQVTEVAKPHYENLFNLRIFHKDMDSVVQFLNNIDVDTWWKEVLNDERYGDFKNTFLKKET